MDDHVTDVIADVRRHANALVSDLAAEFGSVDLVGRRVECSPDAVDALVDAFDRLGVVGGAGVRVSDGEGRLLLVRYDDLEGWIDPGAGRHPGESYRAAATRGVRESTGVEASIDGLAQVHLLYMDDWTARDPVPNPYVSFRGTRRRGRCRAGEGVLDARWADELPAELAYEELAEAP